MVEQAVTSTTTSWRFRTDDQIDANIPPHDPREIWNPPRTLTQAVIDKAKRDLETYEAFMRPAPMGPIERDGTRGHWLMQLSMLCAGQKGSMQEYMEKTAAYAGGLNYPAFCFTSKTLYAAARKFKFIPTFSELAEFFEPMVRQHRVICDRLAALANAHPYAGRIEHKTEIIRRYEDMTPRQKREHDEMMEALRVRLRAAGVGSPYDKEAAEARRTMDAANARQRALLAPILEAKRKALVGDDGPQD